MNLRLAYSFAAVIAAHVGANGAFAHPPGADGYHDDQHHIEPAKIRTWTNVRTGEVVRGAFLASQAADGAVRVSIERETGDVVVFLLEDLSDADKQEAQRSIAEVKKRNQQLIAEAISYTQQHAQVAVAAQTAKRADNAPARVAPEQAMPFDVFAPYVSTRWDDRWLYVESDGLPHAPLASLPAGTKQEDVQKWFVFSHPMMVGITAWQQQVPLPQNYRGKNAWQIPLKPELAEKPVSAKEQLFRGAIALAANGVPIFNPIKNDGRTDTFLAGELDEFGGHCGRADDYHYHIAPTHLQSFVGAGKPIAYALDGFPIYGLFDPQAKQGGPDQDKCCPLGSHEPLDALNGHFGATTKGPGPDGTSTVALQGLYHYHASVKYPYPNGGMRGVVAVKEDQIDPQPRANSPRAALPPLRGAKITGFKAMGANDEPAWSLEYLLAGKKHFVNYRIEGDPFANGGRDAKFIFDYVDATGATKTETYDAANAQRGQSNGGGRGEGGRRRREGEARNDERRPRNDQNGAGVEGDRTRNKPRPEQEATSPAHESSASQPGMKPPSEPMSKVSAPSFSLTSTDVVNGRLSIECTCDSKVASRAPALAWGEPPEGTKAFAIVMHHITRDNDTHVYMVVANIPVALRELKSDDGTKKLGSWGINTVNRKNSYAPPCSQGPGDKTYTITLYALSAEASLPKDNSLTRDVLLAAIKDTTLGTATLDVTYARAAK